MPPDWSFSYDTINQPEEKARLLKKMFGVEEDKELEMQLSLQMDNLEIGVEESKDEF